MTQFKWLFWLYLTIAGTIVGWGIHKAQIQINSDSPPSQWEREKSPVPYRQSALQGTQTPTAGEWGVDFYRAVYPTAFNEPLTSLSLKARIPAEGFLEIWLSTPPIQKRMGDRWMNVCTMQTPRGMLRDPRCTGSTDTGIGLVLSRLSTHSTASIIQETQRGRESLQCIVPTFELTDQTVVNVRMNPNGWVFTVDDAEWTCDIKIAQSVPMLRSGLRQVLLSDVSLNSTTYEHTVSNAVIWVLIGALFSVLIGFLEIKLKIPWSTVVLTSLPMILGIFWQEIDGKVLIEDLRASWMNPYWIATYLSIIPVPFLKLFSFSLHTDHLRSRIGSGIMLISILMLGSWFVSVGWIGILSSAACLIPIYFVLSRWNITHRINNIMAWWWLCSLFMILVSPFHWAGIFWAGILGIAFGTIINANRYTVPHFNWWSLGLFVLCTVSAEVSLRSTQAGLQWSNKGSKTEHNEIFGWVRQANESFELFEEGKHTTYPDKGYPVAVPQKSTSRIVSFGGSTTGGAFQNDNLNEFYPALLNQKLPATSVLNQGVGGWTTWHIRAYFEKSHQTLNADAITLYVGHNDILTSVPLPYKELYPLWQKQRGQQKVGGWLSQIRLYQALRYIIISLRKAEMKLAVPVPDAKENLLAIIEQAGEIDIYLGSEGLSPDPGILYAYNDMMKELANNYENVHYVPIAEALSQYAPHQVFLDDCHLTAFGHQIVAHQFQLAIASRDSTP